MNNQSVCLIGYRACGKTTVARLLAKQLGAAAFDSDVWVEKKANKTIAQIFADEGEPAFRKRETEALAEILSSNEPFVLATGGGVPTRAENRRLLSDSGVYVVWLDASPETIARRMNADSRNAETRPALTPLAPEEEIRTLLENRAPFYRELANETISTDLLLPEEIVARLIAGFDRRREKTGTDSGAFPSGHRG